MILITGCLKPEYNDPAGFKRIDLQREGRLIPGRELEDPYAIHNIIKAYSNLQLSGTETPSVDLKANHVYLRFLPETAEEWEILKKDTTLILYDFPLNFEMTRSGDFYSDSSLPDSSFIWQYCVIPADKELPDIRYEVIYEVFIPPDEDYNSKSSSDDMTRFYEDLVSESVRLTGNTEVDETSGFEARGFSGSKWTPKGTIRVWDDLLGQFIPLVHVNVHARWFTHIETDLTDENGYFQTKRFRHKVNYSIKWENSYYTIRNGMFLQAWYNGPKMKGDWNLDIRGSKSVMFATIHRAAYKHFYGDNLGLNRPILRWGGRTKICYRDDNGTGEFLGDWSGSGIFPDIQIWGKSNGKYKTTNKIFGSTAHELGHQAHSQFIGNLRYWQLSKIIRESWADAVEWAHSNDEYNKLGQKCGNSKVINYNHQYNTHNRWPYVNDRDYSPIFIDLMDKINQRVSIGPDYPNDMITGYSLSYINNNLLGKSSGINSLRDEVAKHKLEGVDDFLIEELFSLYQ
jgi:hypothetical protein